MGVSSGSTGNTEPVDRGSIKVTVPAGDVGAFALRDAVRSLCMLHAIDTPVVDDVVLATQEACNNAVLHSQTAEGTIEVTATVIDCHICVEVKDCGRGLDPDDVSIAAPPDPLAAHGRGLFIIDRLMDSLEIVPCCPGTLVRMTKLIGPEPA